jgi:hypothetical protein
MALMDFIKKQFIDIIQWTEDDGDTMAWRFPMAEMEIQNGASLTVRESQMAVFINEGVVADIFGPGMYKLTTQTLPVLTYLKNWDKLFESPFKSDVYFFSTRQKIDRKWGTPNPVTIRDKDFGMVRLRAFGIYAFHLTDPKAFHSTLSGTLERFTSEQLEGQLRNSIVGHISDIFGESGVPFIDMASNQVEFGNALKAKMEPMFARLRPGARQPQRAEHFAARRIAGHARQAHRREHDGRHAGLHPVPDRRGDPARGAERRRSGRHRCRPWRRARSGSAGRRRHGGSAEPAGGAAERRPASADFCAGHRPTMSSPPWRSCTAW